MVDAQARGTPLKARTIHGITVPEQVLRGRVPRKGLDELLRRPLGGRMLGRVEVDHLPSRVREDDQPEEHFEPDRGDGEEVEGDELRQVAFQEGPPSGRGRPARADAIFLDRGFRHRNPELPQFAENTRGTPPWIRPRDLPNQRSGFRADRRSARCLPAAAGPVVPKALALPGEHGRRLQASWSRTPGPSEKRLSEVGRMLQIVEKINWIGKFQ